jgi:hypothetical protein
MLVGLEAKHIAALPVLVNVTFPNAYAPVLVTKVLMIYGEPPQAITGRTVVPDARKKLDPPLVLISTEQATLIGTTVTALVSWEIRVVVPPPVTSPMAVAVTMLVTPVQWFVDTMQLAEPPTGSVAGNPQPLRFRPLLSATTRFDSVTLPSFVTVIR